MKFYYFPAACSIATHIVLEDLGVAFEPCMVDLRAGENQGAAYLTINPSGAVPALQLDSGEVLTENIAILHWLAESHPGAGLWPASPLQRAQALQWMSRLATAFHASARILWRRERVACSEEANAELQATHRERYLGLLQQAETRIGTGPWVLGEEFSIVDAHLFPYVRWAAFWKMDMSVFPNLQAWYARMMERPAVLRALEREGQPLKLS